MFLYLRPLAVYKTTYFLPAGNKFKMQFQTLPQTPERPRIFNIPPVSPPTPGTPDTPQTPQSLPRDHSKPIKDLTPLLPSQPHIENDQKLSTITGTKLNDTRLHAQDSSLKESQKKRQHKSNLEKDPNKNKYYKKCLDEAVLAKYYHTFKFDSGIHCDTVRDYTQGPRVYSDAADKTIHQEYTVEMENSDSDENQIIMPD
jgi:hypothetical protein